MRFGVVKIDLSSFTWYLCPLSARRGAGLALLPVSPSTAVPLRPASVLELPGVCMWPRAGRERAVKGQHSS